MFAQSLVEYGALSSLIAGGQNLANDVVTWVSTPNQFMWVAVGVIILMWFVFLKPRSPRF